MRRILEAQGIRRQAEEAIEHGIEQAREQLEPLKEGGRVLGAFADMILRRDR